jgi:endonuclease/exonuclease/phosphatase family metal-dependent hydrolase
MRFRIATFNLHGAHRRWEERRELIVQQLINLNPDVLCLNEVLVLEDTGRWVWRRAWDAGMRYAYSQQNGPGYYWAADASAILTRFPVIEMGDFDYAAAGRYAQVARLDLGGATLDVYVTHLHHRNEDSMREYQVHLLLGWIDRRDAPAARVVCGDFNTGTGARSLERMLERFTPSQREGTFPTPLRYRVPGPLGVRDPLEPLSMCFDYVWVEQPLRLIESGRCFDRPSPSDPDLWPSDHVGVWADLALR